MSCLLPASDIAIERSGKEAIYKQTNNKIQNESVLPVACLWVRLNPVLSSRQGLGSPGFGSMLKMSSKAKHGGAHL